jgi:hypothetical protein
MENAILLQAHGMILINRVTMSKLTRRVIRSANSPKFSAARFFLPISAEREWRGPAFANDNIILGPGAEDAVGVNGRPVFSWNNVFHRELIVGGYLFPVLMCVG